METIKRDPQVEDIVAVTGTWAPVLKLVFNGVDVDMVCSRLPYDANPASLKKEDILGLKIFEDMDEQSAISLNGRRATEVILEIVPKPDCFLMAARAIKLWAKRRGLYSQACGFLGGISWNLLLAFIMHVGGEAQTPAGVLKTFFHYYTLPQQKNLEIPCSHAYYFYGPSP